ncbi:DUF3179 domain-containing protein [Candidatus Woesearchaeota archaeon]|nr:DUF3179 domain-containing protein [Candidatus Woesearchaeota archaeon]
MGSNAFRKIFVIVAIVIIGIILVIAFRPGSSPLTASEDTDRYKSKSGNSQSGKIKTTPEGTKYLVHPDKLIGGGPPKNGIPSIDSPEFVSVQEADEWLADDEEVLALEYKGERRVYPLQIMVWHEIVNDNVQGSPVLITYCPLCATGIAFERTIGGEEVEFGTSGKLYNSNLVMYDRKTDSYWTQIGGRAIVGELAGMELANIPISTVKWGNWKQSHPDSKVLSRDTGHIRNYGADPYGNYYNTDDVLFPLENEDEDNTAHPKVIVFGIEINNQSKAYPEAELNRLRTIEDILGGAPITLKKDSDGIISAKNSNTGKNIPFERSFWFAWHAFHPDTEIYRAKS